MKAEFLNLIKNKETALVYPGARGETLILHEKQPHRNTERLFEYFSPSERLMLECALDAKGECSFSTDKLICEITSVAGHSVAAVAPREIGPCEDRDAYDCFARLAEIDFGEAVECGYVLAAEMLSRLIPDVCRIYPDMECEFVGGGWGDELFGLSTPNLMRICMLCAPIADSVSSDRRMEVNIDSTEEELRLTFLTGCGDGSYNKITADETVHLAQFVCEREGGKFKLSREMDKLLMSFVFRSQPDEVPEFKFRDQFEGYDEYFSRVVSDITALRAEKQSKH